MLPRIAPAQFALLALSTLAACSGTDVVQPGLDPSGRYVARRFDPTRGTRDVPGRPHDTTSTPIDAPPSTQPPAATPTAAGVYGLASAAASGCLQTVAGATNAGALTTLGACAPGAASQSWTLPAVGATGTVTLPNGVCLNAFGGFGVVGDRVGLWGCEGGSNERWTLTAAGELKGINGLCVGPKGGVAVAGATYELQSCSGAPTQKWTHVVLAGLTPPTTSTTPSETPISPTPTPTAAPSEPTTASAGLVALANAASPVCFQTAGGATTSGTTTVLGGCDDGAWSQTFLLPAPGATGNVSIQGLCLNAFGGYGAVGDRVGLYGCNNDANSLWTLTAAGELKGINGLCVGPQGGSATAGAALVLQACAGSASQKWTARSVSLDAPAVAVVPVEPAAPAVLAVPSEAALRATGRTLRASTQDEFAAAIEAAMPGDEIVLPPGTVVSRAFLPRRRGSGWITVRTELAAADMPAPGVRLTPETARRLNLAKLAGGVRNDPVIWAQNGSGGWRFVALEITQDPGYPSLNTLISLGWGDAPTLAETPGDFIFDRVYAHALPTGGDLTRCFLLNSARTAILNSTMECHGHFSDAMAIGGWAGPGPFLIDNNSIAGSGHGIIFGGNDPIIADLTPSDIVIRNNRIWKPLAWKGVWPGKTLLETKLAKRLLIEGNLFENNWVDAQAGSAILFKSVSQYGRAPWSQTSDVMFRRNVLRNVAGGFNIAAKPEEHPAVPAARIKIEQNLVYDVGGTQLGPSNGKLLVLSGPLHDVQIVSNTMVHQATGAYAALQLDLQGATNIAVHNNVMTMGEHGWLSSVGAGSKAFTGGTWAAQGNVLAGLPTFSVWSYPAGSSIATSSTAVGFASPSAGDFTLALSSPFLSAGMGGHLPGVNMTQLMSTTSLARSMSTSTSLLRRPLYSRR